jgi:hypothetical protein
VFEKSIEYWAVLLGMAVWVITRDAERESIMRRGSKTLASGLLAVGVSPELAVYLNGSEIWATVLVMAVGLFALDTATALVADREFIKDLIKRKLGGGNE